MIVVADTSPLNYLIRLGHPHVLREIYGRILVPRAVLLEMQHPQAPEEVHAWALAPPSWIEPAEAMRIDATLPADLGAGEREAISIAQELNADLLLIDDRAGRLAAQIRHIEVAGTLAVFLDASLRGHLEFRRTLDRLRQLGFRVSRSVEEAMIVRYELAIKRELHSSGELPNREKD